MARQQFTTREKAADPSSLGLGKGGSVAEIDLSKLGGNVADAVSASATAAQGLPAAAQEGLATGPGQLFVAAAKKLLKGDPVGAIKAFGTPILTKLADPTHAINKKTSALGVTIAPGTGDGGEGRTVVDHSGGKPLTQAINDARDVMGTGQKPPPAPRPKLRQVLAASIRAANPLLHFLSR